MHSTEASTRTPVLAAAAVEKMSFVENEMLAGTGMELHRATVSDVFWLADSYKVCVPACKALISSQVSHHKQYPPGTTHIYSYFESRGGKFAETCFFGLQYLLKRWMTGPVVRTENIQVQLAI